MISLSLLFVGLAGATTLTFTTTNSASATATATCSGSTLHDYDYAADVGVFDLTVSGADVEALLRHAWLARTTGIDGPVVEFTEALPDSVTYFIGAPPDAVGYSDADGIVVPSGGATPPDVEELLPKWDTPKFENWLAVTNNLEDEVSFLTLDANDGTGQYTIEFDDEASFLMDSGGCAISSILLRVRVKGRAEASCDMLQTDLHVVSNAAFAVFPPTLTFDDTLSGPSCP